MSPRPLLPAGAAIGVAVTALEHDKATPFFQQAARDGFVFFRAPAGETELAAAVRSAGARHVVVGVEPYRGPLYEALNVRGVIAHFGVGHDNIDKDLAAARGLWCTNTPGALNDSVAEHSFNLLLAAARQTVAIASAAAAGQWQPRLGGELRGKNLTVIGCGAIGRRVAAIASRGFGMQVVGFKRSLAEAENLQRDAGFAVVTTDFGAAVRAADYVSLHLPSTPATRHFLNRDRLALLPAACWMVNTARGAVVDEAALFEVLAAGRLAGAALDVFDREPYEPAEPGRDLRTLPNVILTPHLGSNTREAVARMAERVLQNLLLAETGRPEEMDLINRVVLASPDFPPTLEP